MQRPDRNFERYASILRYRPYKGLTCIRHICAAKPRSLTISPVRVGKPCGLELSDPKAVQCINSLHWDQTSGGFRWTGAAPYCTNADCVQG